MARIPCAGLDEFPSRAAFEVIAGENAIRAQIILERYRDRILEPAGLFGGWKERCSSCSLVLSPFLKFLKSVVADFFPDGAGRKALKLASRS